MPCSRARDTLDRVPAPVLTLPAEVTVETLPAILADAERLIAGDATALVVDLVDVRFLGSGGLGELVKLGKRLRERGGGIALARPRPPIRKLVMLVGLDSVLRLSATVEEAQAVLAT